LTARRHARSFAVAAVTSFLLAVGACGAPASENGAPSAATAETTTTTVRLADLVEPVGSARYDPAEHRGPRQPSGLSIPAIDVGSAAVLPVGLQDNGEMEIPPAEQVGWYETGSAVLAAHIAYNGVDGVFRHLDRLSDGDEVEVSFDDGSSEPYRITEVVQYRKDALPDEIFSRSEPERLVLITCGGEFNPSLRSYESNVVAYAEPIDPG
jgi:LPXTG-site transpeptidase (sortase) family protein